MQKTGNIENVNRGYDGANPNQIRGVLTTDKLQLSAFNFFFLWHNTRIDMYTPACAHHSLHALILARVEN